tara:strand:+ start:347 stop:544 length:198 start_codon:yes stop_codon:yes gene_type:complete
MTKTITFETCKVDTRRINDMTWILLEQETFTFKGNERTRYLLRKPRGKVEYRGVKYENGDVWICR